MTQSQQIMFPWASYKVSEIARVLGVSRGRTMTALRRLNLVGRVVGSTGIPADRTDDIQRTLDAIARDKAVRASAARAAKEKRQEARDARKARRKK